MSMQSVFAQSRLALALAAATLALAACSSGVKLDDVAANSAPAQPKSTASADSGAANARAVTPVDVTKDELDDPASPLAKRSVYFDFDSYDVKEAYKSVVDSHGKYLVSHRARKVLIQGNTDERGTTEYNLALGQKRADAVRRSLSLLGVPDTQMEAVSLGKEKPKATGHDEAAWLENRRADLVY